MYHLQPIAKERIWGTPRLHSYGGDPTIERIGSVYSASATPDIDCPVQQSERSEASDPQQGTTRTLGELIASNPTAFGLRPGERYPLMVSFTACDQHLSIQVHPSDAYARKKEGVAYGKSEAWYFITPPEDGWIFAEQRLADKKAITQAEHRDFEQLLRKAPVSKGELVYIPSGTIHALTKGALVYEVQQATDITYRFYDYDRKDHNGQQRALHLADALATLNPNGKIDTAPFPTGDKVTFQPFTLHHFTVGTYLENPGDIAAVVTLLSGEITLSDRLVAPGHSVLLLPGECVAVQGQGTCIMAIPHRYT